MSAPPAPAGEAIDLSRTTDFSLGRTRVRPSACEVLGPGGAVRLQPRVMQVLVALAASEGTTLSRDALVARCWGGKAISDDAIARCIQRLRRLSGAEAAGSFTIETIATVGYRLMETRAPIAPEPAATVVAQPGRRPPLLVLAVAAAVIAGLLMVVSTWRPARWSVVSFERLVSGPGIQDHPALSPDGSLIAYAAGPDFLNRQIYLRRVSGGEPVRVTDGPHDDLAPAWSPDGTRLAYVAAEGGQPCRILVMAAPKGEPTEVTRCQTPGSSSVAWLHSPGTLLFVDRTALGGPGASSTLIS